MKSANDNTQKAGNYELAQEQFASGLCDLLEVALPAFCKMPPYLVQSILGEYRSWCGFRSRHSEFNILSIFQPLVLTNYLADFFIPAHPSTAPDGVRALMLPAIRKRLWRPTRFYRQADEFNGVCSFPHEHWFYINGIATNEDVARYNSAYLAHLFHRPVTVIQNAMCSLGVDLFECAIGKGLKLCNKDILTEPAWRASAAILGAINAEHTQRVVVIAHSQGTIIVSNVLATISRTLRYLEDGGDPDKLHEFLEGLMGDFKSETRVMLRNSLAHALSELTRHDGPKKDRAAQIFRRLSKLEIYTFANCADRMCYLYKASKVPRMEHFANENDVIAQLGVLSPYRREKAPLIVIEGDVFVKKNGWGHLLNEHYLSGIDEHLYPFEDERPPNPYIPVEPATGVPHLYGYFHGKDPDQP